ncbi:MAG: HAD family hydrolase [Muribaculaceae bacterium]|nr:HAD family hydrolase [Muribaculaceae bacterium]
MKKLVIFDLDGTLLNTIDDLGAAANYALEQCGFPTHQISSYPFFVGNGVKRLLERVLPEDARTEALAEQMRTHFMQYYDSHNVDKTVPYPGIVELLEQLASRGVKMAVASNKYQSAVEKLIAHYFPMVEWVAVEGQKEDVPVKPDPSIVFEILLKNPTPKAEVLYVGDSGVDMETARRACVESVGVTWGFRPVKELQDFYADNIVNVASEILSIVDKE